MGVLLLSPELRSPRDPRAPFPGPPVSGVPTSSLQLGHVATCLTRFTGDVQVADGLSVFRLFRGKGENRRPTVKKWVIRC